MRRTLTVATLVALVAAVSACGAPENARPICRSDSPTILMAESVPSASLIPCIDSLPGGWAFDTFEADETHATFSLQQQDGGGVLDVQLVPSCDATGRGVAVEGFPTVQRYRSEVDGGSGVVWISTFPGGCSRAELTFPAPPAQADVDRMERAISFFPRDQLRPM
jgi:hypothetical protein